MRKFICNAMQCNAMQCNATYAKNLTFYVLRILAFTRPLVLLQQVNNKSHQMCDTLRRKICVKAATVYLSSSSSEGELCRWNLLE